MDSACRRSARVAVSTLAVVTSSPPFVEGGHLVIARSLVAALRDAGPRGRSGGDAAEPVRPAGGGLPGDVADRRRPDARRSAHRPGHLAALPELRRPAPPPRVLAAAPDARVLRPVGRVQPAAVVEGTHQGDARAGALVWTADRYLLTTNVSRAVRDLGDRAAALRDVRRHRAPRCCTRRRRRAPTASTTTSRTCLRSRASRR